MAAIDLDITLEGDAPGLEAHRLSIAAFKKPLAQLLFAYRRTASSVIREALEDPRYGKGGGAYARAAKELDLEIAGIGPGCLQLRLVSTATVAMGGTYPLFANGLMEQAVIALLDGIRAESSGQLKSAPVRRYLASMPPGVRRQTYRAHRNGTELGRVEVGTVDLPDVPTDTPYLDEIAGTVAGVGFEPGPNEVRISEDDGTITAYSATGVLVEGALALRHHEVVALVVRGGGTGPRLVTLSDAQATEPEQDVGSIVAHVMERWEGVLSRLAQ